MGDINPLILLSQMSKNKYAKLLIKIVTSLISILKLKLKRMGRFTSVLWIKVISILIILFITPSLFVELKIYLHAENISKSEKTEITDKK